MQIGFRADASIEIGSGHVMRCLTLADELYERGAQNLFFCRLHDGHLIDVIKKRGHQVVILPKPVKAYKPPSDVPLHASWLGSDWSADAGETCAALGQVFLDWMVVDHYALDSHWEQALRANCKHMMVIDDLADRMHDCDVLLDQNLGRVANDYHGLVPKSAALLIGPQFALLRPEFPMQRSESIKRRANPTLERLLITLGGVDKDNVTGQVLDVLQKYPLPEGVEITVVMGVKAPWLDQVRDQALLMHRPTKVLTGVTDMARLMVESDLVIGAAGGTSWERCCLGLSAIILVLAENQKLAAIALQDIGASFVIESVYEIGSLLDLLFATDTGKNSLCSMSKAASQVTDGMGVFRVCEQLMADHG